MVDPDRYNMASDMPHLGVARDDDGWYESSGPRGRFINGIPEADRLESALDEALLASASEDRQWGHKNRLMYQGDSVDVCVRMDDMYPWIGNLTKLGVYELFRKKVMSRYVESGWTGMSVQWDFPQSREMTFHFEISKPVQHIFLGGAMFEVTGSYLDVTDRSGNTSTLFRDNMARTLRWLARENSRLTPGKIDGMGRDELRDSLHALVCALDAEPVASNPGWLRATLDDLHVAAKLMGFDLDMTRLDLPGNGSAPDDGYFPPFEGSPDDENFGAEPDSGSPD